MDLDWVACGEPGTIVTKARQVNNNNKISDVTQRQNTVEPQVIIQDGFENITFSTWIADKYCIKIHWDDSLTFLLQAGELLSS